jgi:hypothetical protein
MGIEPVVRRLGSFRSREENKNGPIQKDEQKIHVGISGEGV